MMQKHRTATPTESDADVTFEVGSGNVYADLGLPDAEELQAKGDLAHLIINIVEDRGWKQKRAASEIGIAESEMSDIMNGKLRRFSRERLEHYLTTLGMDIRIQVSPMPSGKKQGSILVHLVKRLAKAQSAQRLASGTTRVAKSAPTRRTELSR